MKSPLRAALVVLGRPLVDAVACVWRRVVCLRARSIPTLVDRSSLMVLAPHPDDETLGCGGLLARASVTAARVVVVVATDGRHSTGSQVISPDRLAELRTAELLTACGRLGVDRRSVVQLGFQDGTLHRCEQSLTRRLVALLDEYRPTTVLVPCRQDDHPDHRSLHTALVRAVAAVDGARARVFGYPVWAWNHGPWFLDAAPGERPSLWAWAARTALGSGVVRVPCGPYHAAKLAALGAYASQVTNLTGEPGWRALSPRFVAMFRQRDEVFLPVAVPARPTATGPGRSTARRTARSPTRSTVRDPARRLT